MNVSVTCLLGKMDNNRYGGLLNIEENIFTCGLSVLDDYEVKRKGLRLGVGLIKDDRAIFKITLKKGEVVFKLTDYEYNFFSATIGAFVYDFERDDMVRKNRDIDKKTHLANLLEYDGLRELTNVSCMPRIFDFCPEEIKLL